MKAVKWTGFLGSSLWRHSEDRWETGGYTNLREGLDLSAVACSALAGEETEGAVTGCFVLDDMVSRYDF